MKPRIVEEEFASLYGRTVKLHLKQPDGSFKNIYHHYKTEEKARKLYEKFIGGCNKLLLKEIKDMDK